MLDDLCSITKQHCPFDPYEVTNLSDAKALQAVRDTFVNWATIIANATEEEITRAFAWLYADDNDTKTSSMTIKQDVLDTLEFVINKMAIAEKSGDTITIIGI